MEGAQEDIARYALLHTNQCTLEAGYELPRATKEIEARCAIVDDVGKFSAAHIHCASEFVVAICRKL